MGIERKQKSLVANNLLIWKPGFKNYEKFSFFRKEKRYEGIYFLFKDSNESRKEDNNCVDADGHDVATNKQNETKQNKKTELRKTNINQLKKRD